MKSAQNAVAPEEATSGNGASRNVGITSALPLPAKPVAPSVLTDEMLARFASRAAGYDKENRFFNEDFEELRAAKYLLLPVPAEFGGAGLTLAEVCREQRRLAYYAPATALAWSPSETSPARSCCAGA